MKGCPVGAIITRSEIVGLCEALVDAVELVECDRRSNWVSNPKWRNDEDRKEIETWRKKLKRYASLQKKLAAL